MTEIGQRYISIRGTYRNVWRTVRKDTATNTYWIKLKGNLIEVRQSYNDIGATGDWHTLGEIDMRR